MDHLTLNQAVELLQASEAERSDASEPERSDANESRTSEADEKIWACYLGVDNIIGFSFAIGFFRGTKEEIANEIFSHTEKYMFETETEEGERRREVVASLEINGSAIENQEADEIWILAKAEAAEVFDLLTRRTERSETNGARMRESERSETNGARMRESERSETNKAEHSETNEAEHSETNEAELRGSERSETNEAENVSMDETICLLSGLLSKHVVFRHLIPGELDNESADTFQHEVKFFFTDDRNLIEEKIMSNPSSNHLASQPSERWYAAVIECDW